MKKIELPIIFGPKSKDRLLGGASYLIITLDANVMITRVRYDYETPKFGDDELSGYESQKLNEKLYVLRGQIVQIGLGFDNDCECYFVAIEKGSGKINSFNVESAEKGNELLTQLVEWWQF